VYAQDKRIHCLGGSSTLARGGSGDLLTGIIGGLLAKGQFDSMDSALLGARWHARAAEILTLLQGQEAVFATELLDYLSHSFENDF
jgi:NAD(P)H-hydrate epimerase